MAIGAGKSVQSHAGAWVVTEYGGRLLSLGNSLYYGQSLRSQLQPLGRRYLIPLIAQAVATAATAERTFTDQGVSYNAQAIPILGPTGKVHAVKSNYTETGREPHPHPDIGAWEWDAPALRTHWTPELFRVYGFPEPPEGRTSWEAPEWFGLTESGGFPVLMEVLARFQTGLLTDLQIHLFRVTRPDTGAIQRLRMSGRTIYEDGADKARWFRGVTMRVDGYQLEIEQQFNQQQYLDAAFILNPSPVSIVDLATTQVMLNNKSWTDAGLDMPADRLLISVVHPDDRIYVNQFLRSAVVAPSAEPSVTVVRMAAGAGWVRTELSAVRLNVEQGDLAIGQVMIRLNPTQ